jgi:predicted NACHT family NTPase
MSEPDFLAYLQSICDTEKYRRWWNLYTVTDVEGTIRDEREFSPFDFGLMVETVLPKKRDELNEELRKNEPKEKIERLPVLEGLRKYAQNPVLLVGRPGSGKSTALARLLLEMLLLSSQREI